MARVTTEVRADGTNVLARKAEEVTLVGFALTTPRCSRGTSRGTWCDWPRPPCASFRSSRPRRGGRRRGWEPGRSLLSIAMIAGAVLAAVGVVVGRSRSAPRPGALVLLATGRSMPSGSRPCSSTIAWSWRWCRSSSSSWPWPGRGRGRPADERRAKSVVAAGLAVVLGVISLVSLLRAHDARLRERSSRATRDGRVAGRALCPGHAIMTAAASVGFYFHDVAHADRRRCCPGATRTRCAPASRAHSASGPCWSSRNGTCAPCDIPRRRVLLHPDRRIAGLRHVATLGDEASGRIVVYEIAAPPGTRRRHDPARVRPAARRRAAARHRGNAARPVRLPRAARPPPAPFRRRGRHALPAARMAFALRRRAACAGSSTRRGARSSGRSCIPGS